MSIPENKTIARRYFEEIWNGRDPLAPDALVAPQVIGHVANATLQGSEVLKQRVEDLYNLYTEPHFTLEDQVAEGDKVLTRWTFHGRHTGKFMGAAPTGRQVTMTGMSLFRFSGGK